MLIEIKDTDVSYGHTFATGIVEASDGEEVAFWYYSNLNNVTEIWFEPDREFIDILSTRQILFLEKMICKEMDQYEKDQEEFEASQQTGVMP